MIGLAVMLVAVLPALATQDLAAERPEHRLERTFSVGDASVVRVDVELGGDDVESATTIKAEDRRLMAINVRVPEGHTTPVSFLVAIQRPQIIGEQEQNPNAVVLSSRERESRTWDGELSLEFVGNRPRVRRLTLTPIPTEEVTRVFLAGDSTVTDQPAGPYAGWGQALPLSFGPRACVVNVARSGLTLGSFKGGRRLSKILSDLRPGDFVLVQFGHNDQKDKREGAGAFTTYAQGLREYVAAIRERGGRPVLITPVGRRRFDADGNVTESLGDYPQAMRQVARELDVPLVDLNASSKRLYQALGIEGSRRVFVHYGPGGFPGLRQAIEDNSHFSDYGSHQIARCVVEEIRTGIPDLARLLRADVQPFDPTRPDAPTAVDIPPHPAVQTTAPGGS